MEPVEDAGCEECCAVCADPLEWVAYGPCGHRDVCSTCVARLRFVLADRRCCICKQESEAVVVTRAGKGTNLRAEEFAGLPLRMRTGPGSGGDLWFEPNVQAYLNDIEQFRMLKALCRLSCSVCESLPPGGEPIRGAVRKGHTFRHIEDMRRHLSGAHKLVMCDLCLEGRKVFVCEQKLYSRTQLERHSAKGDSEVDGTEEERGGFSGHPLCAFCKKRFYGDNELYAHMTQDHYKCHLCQQARPGHYEYYRNYDDLEAHFRHDHLLCEDSECLAKKFVVFGTEAELKRHNAITHGGKMSRSQRNAALQIPVSFQYRRPRQEEGERGGGRRRGRPYIIDNDVSTSAAISASLEASLEDVMRESAEFARANSGSSASASTRSPVDASSDQDFRSRDEGSVDDANGELETGPSRYRQAVYGAGSSTLGDSAFPPLPGQSSNAARKAKMSTGSRSVAAILGGGRANIRVLNSAQSKKSQKSQGSGGRMPPALPQRSVDGAGIDSRSRNEHSRASQTPRNGVQILSVADSGGPGPPAPSALSGDAALPLSSSRGPGNGSPIRPPSPVGQLTAEEIRTGNKALVEQIRAGLRGNDQQFAEFKNVSQEWRKGAMSSQDYYIHIVRLGLSHVVPDLARLCPDRQKQVELLDAHNFVSPPSWNVTRAVAGIQEAALPASKQAVGKGKQVVGLSGRVSGDYPPLRPGASEAAKCDSQASSSNRSVCATETSESPVSGTLSTSASVGWECCFCTLQNNLDAARCAACGSSKANTTMQGSEEVSDQGIDALGKRKKKTSKFNRIRLGDGSAALMLQGLDDASPGQYASQDAVSDEQDGCRGVWNNGGGQRLVSRVTRGSGSGSAWERSK